MDGDNMLSKLDNLITYDDMLKYLTMNSIESDFPIMKIIDKYNGLNNDNSNKIMIIVLKKYFDINNLTDKNKSLVLAKICKTIIDDKILIFMITLLGNKPIELHQDENKLTAIDYLIYRKKYNVLEKLLEIVVNLEFINFEENSLFYLVENNDKNNYGLILNIIDKCNVHNIYDKFNNNIILKLLQCVELKNNVDIKALSSVIDTFNIFEQNIFKESIYSIALDKIGEKVKMLFKNKYLVDSQLKESIKNPYNINIEFANYNFNPNYLLTKCDRSDFKTDCVSATLYYLLLAKQFNDVETPYCNDKSYKPSDNSVINDDSKLSNNNFKKISMVYNLNNNIFPRRMPFIMIFDNEKYYFNTEFIQIVKKSVKRFVVLKIILALNKTFHANVVIVDKHKKTVERFEPYGDFLKSDGLNDVIIENIAKPLDYSFIICNGVGFQSISDESNKRIINCNLNEPKGYCLAWCHLYLDLRLNDKFKDMNPCFLIKIINNYVINKFKNDYDIDNICQNMFIIFIRFYAKNLMDRIANMNLHTINEIKKQFEIVNL